MKKNQVIRMSSLILILLGFQLAVFAQTKGYYITPIDLQDINLSDSQKIEYQKLENNLEYRSLQFVEIGELQNFIDNNELTFNIPGIEEKYVALAKESAYISPINYMWNGDLIDHSGSIEIFCEDGSVFAYIVIENQVYEIFVFDEWYIFIEYNTEYISKQRGLQE